MVHVFNAYIGCVLRNCLLILFLYSLTPTVARAQDVTTIPGWEILPDSLFLIWHLDQDQITRLRVIEEDYDTERQHVAANVKVDEAGKAARLRKLGIARLDEIEGVLGGEYFSDWRDRIRGTAPKKP